MSNIEKRKEKKAKKSKKTTEKADGKPKAEKSTEKPVAKRPAANDIDDIFAAKPKATSEPSVAANNAGASSVAISSSDKKAGKKAGKKAVKGASSSSSKASAPSDFVPGPYVPTEAHVRTQALDDDDFADVRGNRKRRKKVDGLNVYRFAILKNLVISSTSLKDAD